MKYFEEFKSIGQGGFGKVFCANHIFEQKKYAIKQIVLTA